MKFTSGLQKIVFNHPLPQVVLTILAVAISFSAQDISIKSNYQKGDFKLVHKKQAAQIFVSLDDFKVVQIAAADLASDIEGVTGTKPTLINESSDPKATVVIIGTLGKNKLIDGLVQAGRLDVSQIRGKRESYSIQRISNTPHALVIIGSDRRGTAFGVYELSQIIGVSPWHWWADVTPERRTDLIISKGTKIGSEPSVKYRGIFLNDEDWGLQPWAAKTFEPETGDIGPKTYAKIFELLLRLKANTLWPAMHEVTKPFNFIAANRQVADDYAIVMGSSHAEPMLRNNVGEWKANKNDYNFVTNPSGVTEYWDQRVRENGKFENIYTIGMRGIHDSPILGTKSQAERIPLLEKIFSVQRGLMAKHVRSEVETIPQIFCPYKEVLADYRAGLKVPDDVTIVFPDDNFGYIRQFPNAEERKRNGGFGVYYHISYLGRPLSYLWLNSTPPALIFEEMSKAYNNGMREFWMLNVGDIKPAEIGIELFMQMAYDADKWNVANQHQFLEHWARREFGAEDAAKIAAIMDTYYRLGFQRKPEHLQWYLPTETPRKSDLTEDEALVRLADYAELRKQAESVYAQLSITKEDAFYELVLYPVRSSMLANERFFAAELAETYKQQGRSDAINWARLSLGADAEIAKETKYFNEQLAGGKWRYMMSPEMNPGQWPSMRTTPPKIDLASFENSPPFSPTKTTEQEPANVISVEAEDFIRKSSTEGFVWQVIKGLGKTGDSVSVFPNLAKTFSGGSPSLEYKFQIEDPGEFDLNFLLIPTQPLVQGNGLRIAFSVDGQPLQNIAADKDTEVSSRKWSLNVLNQTTIATGKVTLGKGSHILKVFAVDRGVVLDRIELQKAAK